MTRTDRVRVLPEAPPNLPERSKGDRSQRETWSAGTRPTARAVATASAAENASTRPSTLTSCMRGRETIPPPASTCTTSTAITVPITAPPKTMSALSASDGATICRRPAPRAVRTATSDTRDAARTSNRFATLAQAIKSTNMTAPSIAQSGASTSPTICCRSGTAATPIPASSFGNAWAMRLATVLRSRWALASVTPLRNRAIAASE